jgi:hypothetical protein
LPCSWSLSLLVAMLFSPLFSETDRVHGGHTNTDADIERAESNKCGGIPVDLLTWHAGNPGLPIIYGTAEAVPFVEICDDLWKWHG